MSFADVQNKTTLTGFSAVDEATILAAMRTAYEGSATARAMFDSWIAVPTNTITINFLSGQFRAYRNTGRLEIDLNSLTQAMYIDNNGTAVKDTAVTSIVHELVHALTGRSDNTEAILSGATIDYRQPTVTFANIIYSELGLAEQNSYIAYDGIGDILTLNFQYTKGTAIDRAVARDSDWDSSAAGNSKDLLIGGASGNVLSAGDGSDFLYGNGGNDTLDGGQGNDYLEGNADNDLLRGGKGNDTLLGGTGQDIYQFSADFGLDIVQDSDGQGSFQMDGSALNGGKRISANVWESADRKYRYTVVDGQLLINVNSTEAARLSGAIIVQSWQPGALNLALDGEAGTAATTGLFTGDFNKAVSPDGKDFLFVADGNYMPDGVQSGAADLITGSAAADLIQGLGGNDALLGLAGDDVIEGGAGNDVLQGGLGRDTLRGGDGNDLIYGSSNGSLAYPQTTDFEFPAAPYPHVLSAGFNWVLSSPGLDADGFHDGFLTYTVGRDQQNGDAGNLIDGGAGNDVIYAGTGDDVVHGGSDADDIWGVSGNDVLFGDEGNDRIRGDGVIIANAVIYTPPDQHGYDILIGGAGNDLLMGQGKDDILLGGADDDILYGDDRDLTQTPIAIHGNDYLDGGSGNDTLYGNNGDDTLIGGTGNDTLNGGAGIDTYIYNVGDGVDTIIDSKAEKAILRFGAGVDSNNITLRLGSLMLDLGNGDAVHVEDFDAQDVFAGAAISGFEFANGTTLSTQQLLGRGFDLDGTQGDDWIQGTNTTDRINGFEGNDTLLGSMGTDTIHGGDGADQIAGDMGGTDPSGDADMLFGDAGNDLLLGQGGDDLLDGGGDNDELQGGEGDDILLGGDGADTLFGQAGNDTLAGGSGADTLVGDGGNDTYRFGRRDGADIIHDLDATEGNIDRVAFAADVTQDDVTASRVPGTYNLQLRINGTNDVLTLANYYSSASHQVEEICFADGTVWTPATLPNFIQGTDNSEQLYGTSAADVFQSGAGSDILLGYAGDDTYRFSRGDGADLIYDTDATPGNRDTVVFAANIDPALAHFSRVNNDLNIDVDYGDLVRIANYFNNDGDSPSSVEQIKFLFDGSVWTPALVLDKIGTGTDSDDVLFGRDGTADTLDGMAGNDTLWAGGGNDTLIGGTGNDILHGQAGSDSYVISVNAGSDTVQEDAGGLFSDDDQLVLIDGISYADVAFSRSGSDLLLSSASKGFTTRIVGQFGTDGNANGVERVVFANGQSLDRAALKLEVVRPTNGDDVLEGDDTGETVDALAGNDSVYGKGGNDILRGNTGADILYGGLGDDTFMFELGDGADTVVDTDPITGGGGLDTLRFGSGINPAALILSRQGADLLLTVSATDRVTIRNYFTVGDLERISFADGTVWTQATIAQKFPINGTSGADTLQGTNAADVINGSGNPSGTTDVIYGYEGDDVLDGGAGADIIYGGNGNDTILGGTETAKKITWADTLYGEGGNDYLVAGGAPANMYGGMGNDIMTGGGVMYGGQGNNLYYGKGKYIQCWFDVAANDIIVVGKEGEVFDDANNQRPSYGRLLLLWNAGDSANKGYYQLSSEANDIVSVGQISYSRLAIGATANGFCLTASGSQIIATDIVSGDIRTSTTRYLQFMVSASDYAPASSDPLKNHKVVVIDYRAFLTDYLATGVGVQGWDVLAGLRRHIVSSSDTEAFGGALAFEYGTKGNIDAVSLDVQRAILADPNLNLSAQPISGAPLLAQAQTISVNTTATTSSVDLSSTAAADSTAPLPNSNLEMASPTPDRQQRDNTAITDSAETSISPTTYQSPTRTPESDTTVMADSGQTTNAPSRQTPDFATYLRPDELEQTTQGGAASLPTIDTTAIFAQWLAVDMAIARALADANTSLFSDELGSDVSLLSKATNGYLGSTALYGKDVLSLPCNLRSFSGLQEGLVKLS